MSTAAETFKINLNQNLWGLIVSLITLGISEYFELRTLFVFGIILSIISSLSYLITTVAYTINYCKGKMNK